jgi:hypothetical protein
VNNMSTNTPITPAAAPPPPATLDDIRDLLADILAELAGPRLAREQAAAARRAEIVADAEGRAAAQRAQDAERAERPRTMAGAVGGIPRVRTEGGP